MGGTNTRVLNRTDFTQSGLGASTTATVVVQRKIDLSRWVYAGVTARLHPTPTWQNAARVDVQWQPDGFTEEDPNQNWAQVSASYPVTLLTFTAGTDTAPILKFGNITPPPPGLMMLMLKFTQGTTGGATFTVAMSLDLTLHE